MLLIPTDVGIVIHTLMMATDFVGVGLRETPIFQMGSRNPEKFRHRAQYCPSKEKRSQEKTRNLFYVQSLCLSCRRCNLHGWALYWVVQQPPYNMTPGGGSYGRPKVRSN